MYLIKIGDTRTLKKRLVRATKINKTTTSSILNGKSAVLIQLKNYMFVIRL